MRKIILYLVVLVICGCSNVENLKQKYTYLPYEGVEVNINLGKRKYVQEYKYTSLYFELQITNNTNIGYTINVGELQAEINGKKTDFTYYAGYASVMPKAETLNKGESSYSLYFVLKGDKKLESINRFQIVNFGLNRK